MKEYYVYILKSSKDGGYYSGSTSNLTDRLQRHFGGRSKATKYRKPLYLVYKKAFPSRQEAIKFERYIKKQKSKKYIEKIIKNN